METPSLTAPSSPPRQTGNDKLLAILCHLSGFLGVPLILPLIIYLVMKEDSFFVKDHAREALNFHISITLYSLLCVPLVMLFVGIPLIIGLGVFSFVVAIIAALRVSDGLSYRYPLTLRLV